MDMALFSNTITGLEFSRNGVGVALLRRGKGLPVLEHSAFQPVSPEVLSISRRTPNVLDSAAFVQQLKAVRRSLPANRFSRVALSLPDEAGRIVLLDLDETWKSRNEAADMLLWKLKKSMPHDYLDLHLDFQVLLQREGASSLVLVSLIARQIVEQYENLLYAAGFQPAWIDLHQVSLLRAFAGQIGSEGTRVFVSWYGENLGIVVIHDGVPVFWRSKYLPVERGNGEHIDQELHGSLEAYHRQWPGGHEVHVFFFSPLDQRYQVLLASLWGEPPAVLAFGSLFQQGAGSPAIQIQTGGMIAAIAAAAGRL